MKIIIVNGSNTVGKNNFVKFFSSNLQGVIYEISTVDVIKKISKKYFGWNGKKDESSRKFLSDMKKLWTEFNDGPFIDTIERIERKSPDYVFIYCREPSEITKFKNYYNDNLITILIKRDDRIPANNFSDMNVDNYVYDYYIYNNGDKEMFKETCIQLYEEMKKNNKL
jgi:hypothetical protein